MLFNCCNVSTEQEPIDDLGAAQCTHDAVAPLQNVINDENYIVVPVGPHIWVCGSPAFWRSKQHRQSR
jgi:hypothetical protein